MHTTSAHPSDTSDQQFAYAYFSDRDSARAAVQNLIERGFDSEHIGVVLRDESANQPGAVEHKTGVGAGAAIGGLLGLAAGAAALPAAGVIAVGGAFATLGGAATGGAAGSLMGVLGGLGVWKEDAELPNEAFEAGGVLVGALTGEERTGLANEALTAAGARETKVAPHIESRQDLADAAQSAKGLSLPQKERTHPDVLARKIFVLTVACVIAFASAIFAFIRPV
jgi:hypothetical protein